MRRRAARQSGFRATTAMTAPLQWIDLALRLALTGIAGIVIGDSRSEHGKAAGIRTNILICLAASAAIRQLNLRPSVGRPISFARFRSP